MKDKGLKVNIGKIKMTVSGSKRKIVSSKIDPCRICGKRVGSNAVLHTVYEVDTWEMHENEKGNVQFCKTFCL